MLGVVIVVKFTVYNLKKVLAERQVKHIIYVTIMMGIANVTVKDTFREASF